MNKKNRKTLENIFSNPTKADILWSDIETLFEGLGAKLEERQGSRIGVKLNGQRAIFHRPHPNPTTDKGAVKAVRDFLKNAGVNYDEI